MVKQWIGLVMVAALVMVVRPVCGQTWQGDQSYRVSTLGGATLAVEDETTALTLFNHANPAGMVLLPKTNRLDLGLEYTRDTTHQVSGPFDPEKTDTFSNLELTAPGGQFRGLTFWLDKSLVARASVEGFLMTLSNTQTATPNEQFNLNGLTGHISLAYQTPFALAVGGYLTYTGAGGKPQSLDGMYAFDSNTTKVELTASNLDWGLGVGYALEQLGGPNTLQLGLHVGADNERPDLAGFNLMGYSAFALSDYSFTVDMAGTPSSGLGPGVETEKVTGTNSPFKVAGEAIFNLGDMFSAGVLLDYKQRDTQAKDQHYKSLPGQPVEDKTTDYKIFGVRLMDVEPVVRASLPLTSDLRLLPGLMYTTNTGGFPALMLPFPITSSGSFDIYQLNSSDQPYRSTVGQQYNSIGTAGLGLQALNKQLQAGVQFSGGTSHMYAKGYNSLGNQTSNSSVDLSLTSLGGGAEFWVIPMLALRAGYLATREIVGGNGTGDGEQRLGRLTLGAGLALPQGITTDLMVRLDNITQDPAPDPAVTHTITSIFLGAHLPI